MDEQKRDCPICGGSGIAPGIISGETQGHALDRHRQREADDAAMERRYPCGFCGGSGVVDPHP